MSKMVDALNKVKEERQRQSAVAPMATVPSFAPSPVSPRGKNGSSNISFALTATLLVIVASGSVLVNFKTMSELKNAKTTSVTMSGYIQEQSDQLQAIQQYLQKEELAQEKQKTYVAKLEGEVKGLKSNIKNLESSLTKIDDLKVNNKLLLEKFIALNDHVKELEANAKLRAEN